MLFCLLTACYIKCPPAARFLSHIYFLMTQQSGRIYETRINLFWKAEVLANNPRLCQRLNVNAEGCLMPALWQWEKKGENAGVLKWAQRQGTVSETSELLWVLPRYLELTNKGNAWGGLTFYTKPPLYTRRGAIIRLFAPVRGGNYLRERSEAVFCSRSSTTGLIAHLGWSPVLIRLVSRDFASLDLMRVPDTVLWQSFISINWGLYMKSDQLNELNFAMLLWHITFLFK